MYYVVFTEKRAKQRELDMKCQRHNSEAVTKGMDEKLKEKEKEHRFGSIYNIWNLSTSDLRDVLVDFL